MKKDQEYIKDLSSEKKKELDDLLQKEGSKSKFRTKIQMTWVYIFASAIILIALLVTNYLLADQNHLYYLPLIICYIVALFLYLFYFWRWIKDYKKIKDYVQTYWFKLYKWVLALTIASFVICFICNIVPVAQKGAYGEEFLGNSLPIYTALLVGIIIDILFSLISASLDVFVIYHLEVDLQRLITEYEENQVDYLKEKIKFEAEKFKNVQSVQAENSQIESTQEPTKQVALTQEEIDKLLKENSLLNNNEENEEDEQQHVK